MTFRKGNVPWSKGLTKETDPRLKDASEKLKGRHISEETRKKLQRAHLGKPSGMKDHVSPFRGHHHSSETRKKISNANKGNVSWNRGLTKETDERVRRNSISLKGRIAGMNNKHHSSKTRKRISIALEGHKPSSTAFKKGYDQRRWMQTKPNKQEMKLESLLNELCPKEFKYVGDGQVVFDGFCPDFVNVNGKKQIIELFGDYWHKGEDGSERIERFAKYGYSTLIIWENELKRSDDLTAKIMNFIMNKG